MSKTIFTPLEFSVNSSFGNAGSGNMQKADMQRKNYYFPLFCDFLDRKAISSTCSICPFYENKIYELLQFVLSLI